MSERWNTSCLALSLPDLRQGCQRSAVNRHTQQSWKGQLTCVAHIWTNNMTRSESTHQAAALSDVLAEGPSPREGWMHFYCLVFL